jgi:ERCC4-related helicase
MSAARPLVHHERFGIGEVVADLGATVVVRFAEGQIHECLAGELVPRAGLEARLAAGELGDSLAALVRAQALAIRSINDQWGVFARSKITLLPHQLWVCRKVREQWPTRWLIADDVGLGKTIEAGLVLSPLIASARVRRLLVLCPASLVEQWQQRMSEMFDIRLTRYTMQVDDRRGDFWKTSPLVVASFHTLRMEHKGRRQRLLDADPWDLVVVDEAHHLNADPKRGSTLAYDLLDSLQQHGRIDSLLCFTGTPHRGKDFGFLALVRLVRPDLFDPERPIEGQWPRLREAMIRNNKHAVTDLEGNRLFQPVTVEPATFGYSAAEQEFYDTVTEFILSGKAYAARLSAAEQQSVMLVLITMQKLAASSVAAVRRALEGRLASLRDRAVQRRRREDRLADLRRFIEEGYPEEQDAISRLEEEIAADIDFSLVEQEEPWLERLIELADAVREETKIGCIIDLIARRFADEQVLLFTEYKATQALVLRNLERRFGRGCTTFINGDEALALPDAAGHERIARVPRVDAAAAFNSGDVRFLVSTEAAAEGIDLQERCAVLIHVDLPWNPMRLHQRVGRLSRYGQSRPVTVVTLRNPDTVEGKIWEKLNEKIERIMLATQNVMDEPEDLLQLVLGMTSPALFNAVFVEASRQPQERLSDWFDQKTATFGGADVVDTVRRLVGSVQRFDFGQVGRDLPKVDLGDLVPFFRNVTALHHRRLEQRDDGYALIVPDEWRKRDFTILADYSGLVFERRPSAAMGRGVQIMGVGHRLFDIALRQAEEIAAAPATLRGRSAPIYLFKVRERVTGTGSQVGEIVLGVEPHPSGGAPELLRDWQVLLRLNALGSPRRQSGSSDMPAEPLGVHADRLASLARLVEGRLDQLGITYRAAEVVPAGVLLPTLDATSGSSAADHLDAALVDSPITDGKGRSMLPRISREVP